MFCVLMPWCSLCLFLGFDVLRCDDDDHDDDDDDDDELFLWYG